MANFLKNFFSFCCLCSVFLLKAELVFALEVKYPDILGKSLDDSSTLGNFVCYLFNAGVSLAITIAVCTIVYGAIYYIISYGRGSFTSEAKDWIKSGILGMLIIVCASLILYTINPDVKTCKISLLANATLPNIFGTIPASSTPVSAATYNEIPVGTLVENLLTRTSIFASYDKYGDIVMPDPSQSTGGNSQPSNPYVNEDRVTGLRQMIEGAQRKARVAAELSDEITKLMNTCSCRIKDANGKDTGKSKCDPTCDPANGGCPVKGSCPGGSCDAKGACFGGSCKPSYSSPDCCPTGVKEKIEHGPIYVHIDVNKDPDNNTQVTCDVPCTEDSDCQSAGSKELNRTNTKETMGPSCDPDTHTCGVKYKGLDEFRCPLSSQDKKMQKCEDIMPIISTAATSAGNIGVVQIYPDKWYKLTLWQQLKWFQEYILAWSDTFGLHADIQNLQSARQKISQCHRLVAATDMLKSNEVLSLQKQVIIKSPTQLVDFSSGKTINSSQYCTGFNYDKSDCLGNCNKQCPDSGATSAYAECKDASCLTNAFKTKKCNDGTDFNSCLKTCQDDCAKDCVSHYPGCSPERSACEQQCESSGQCAIDNADKCLFASVGGVTACAKNNADDSSAFNACIYKSNTCINGSKQHSGYPDCISNFNDLDKKCSTLKDLTSCIAEKQNGVCMWLGDSCGGFSKSVKTTDPLYCSNLTGKNTCEGAGCIWSPAHCLVGNLFPDSQVYSATYLYENPNNQKCPIGQTKNPQTNVNGLVSSLCVNIYPETAKCPASASSGCPTCPCGKIDEPFGFLVPNRSTAVAYKKCTNSGQCAKDQICIQKVCMSNGKENIPCKTDAQCCKTGETCSTTKHVCVTNAGDEGYVVKTPNITVYQMVSPQCNGYAYNDDPLTYYCEDNWWNDFYKEKSDPSTPIGKEKNCSKKEVIPIGQTIDNSLAWTKTILKVPETTSKLIQPLLDQMKKMGNAIETDESKNPYPQVANYCKCGAQFEDNTPMCTSGCQYHQQQVMVDVNTADANGNPITIQQLQWQCSCDLDPCKGSPCQQMVDYHSQLWNAYIKFMNDADSPDHPTDNTCNKKPSSGTTKFGYTVKPDYISTYTWFIEEPRSDILKQLTYSRQQTDYCSTNSTAYGQSQVRLLNCSRAENELLPPINQDKIQLNGKAYPGKCYGEKLGKAAGADLTDDWMCCTQWSDTQSKNKDPLYELKNNNL